MRTRSFAAALFAVAVLTAAGSAEARHVKFLGGHPVAARYGGGYCYIESPHLHLYAPDHVALYQQVGDQYVFTGDPTPFGFDGDKHTFYGHHPVVTVGTEPVYCYINGPHFHAFAAPEAPDYQVRDGVAFYVGAFPPAYVKLKPARARMVNAEYRPFVSFRPVVTVAPPPEWHGEVYVDSPEVHVRGPAVGVEVGAPRVIVSAPPPPRVQVEISAPGVYVAPPRGEVVVGGPVFIGGERRREHDDDGDRGEHRGRGDHEEHGDWHHDNGKHKGWEKHHGRDD